MSPYLDGFARAAQLLDGEPGNMPLTVADAEELARTAQCAFHGTDMTPQGCLWWAGLVAGLEAGKGE